MKTSQKAAKLYPRLRPVEQANLAIEAIMQGDIDTVDAVEAAVPRVLYKDYHVDYARRIAGLQLLDANYCALFWKNRALMFFCNQRAQAGDAEFTTLRAKCLAKIVAIEAAFTTVCERLKIDPSLMRKSVGVGANSCLPKELPPADEGLVKHYIDLFSGLVPG